MNENEIAAQIEKGDTYCVKLTKGCLYIVDWEYDKKGFKIGDTIVNLNRGTCRRLVEDACRGDLTENPKCPMEDFYSK